MANRKRMEIQLDTIKKYRPRNLKQRNDKQASIVKIKEGMKQIDDALQHLHNLMLN